MKSFEPLLSLIFLLYVFSTASFTTSEIKCQESNQQISSCSANHDNTLQNMNVTNVHVSKESFIEQCECINLLVTESDAFQSSENLGNNEISKVCKIRNNNSLSMEYISLRNDCLSKKIESDHSGLCERMIKRNIYPKLLNNIVFKHSRKINSGFPRKFKRNIGKKAADANSILMKEYIDSSSLSNIFSTINSKVIAFSKDDNVILNISPLDIEDIEKELRRFVRI